MNRPQDKYLTEAKIKLSPQSIKKMFVRPKTGTYVIDKNDVRVTVSGDTMIWKYPSDYHDLTYLLIDISDEMGYDHQQIGMSTKKDMKFVIDLGGL
ncbi:MAG: hypothetical protein KAS32_11780 [Candidatus Peribacteraceae bacterium]|nr:hypothetical protein [Candidatus Peribacteraceae bacterium]